MYELIKQIITITLPLLSKSANVHFGILDNTELAVKKQLKNFLRQLINLASIARKETLFILTQPNKRRPTL